MRLLTLLAKKLIAKGTSEAVFVLAFMLLVFQLGSRGANVEDLLFSAISVQDDMFAVQFAHQKNDSEGNRVKHTRYVSDNTVEPGKLNIILGSFGDTTPEGKILKLQ